MSLPSRPPRTRAVSGRGADDVSALTPVAIAANLDTAAVVEPVDPSPDSGRIERLLSLAWESGATPILVFLGYLALYSGSSD